MVREWATFILAKNIVGIKKFNFLDYLADYACASQKERKDQAIS